MLFNYINLIFEVTANVFRAIGACALLLTFAHFAGIAAINMCNGLSVVLGIVSVSCAIVAAVAVYTELEHAAEKVHAFRYWRASVKNM